MENTPEEKRESTKENPKPPRAIPWTGIFIAIFLLTSGKWLIVGIDTREFLNGYLLAMIAWLICSIQSLYTKIPSSTKITSLNKDQA